MKMSRLEKSVRVVLKFSEACNRHDVGEMMSYLSDDCRFESSRPAPDGAIYIGKTAISQYWQAYFQQYPQTHLDVEEIFGLGLRCIMRRRTEWVDETGQPQHVRGVDIFQLKSGLISEMRAYTKV